MSINRVIISGNLTRDPELRQTQSGMAVLSFGVAVNDRRKNPSTGEWEDYPNFVDCTMFGARANSLANYLSKGTKVSIEGKLRWSQWNATARSEASWRSSLTSSSSCRAATATVVPRPTAAIPTVVRATVPRRPRTARLLPLRPRRLPSLTLPLPCTMTTFRSKRNERG